MKRHPWEARLAVGLVMLLLAFLGMVLTDVQTTGGWDYWKWMAVVYGFLALALSWYVRRELEVVSPITLWHELLHWVGLFLAVLMVSLFVHLGTISRFIAGLFDLTLIAFAVFIAGIYIEKTFLFIGLTLGLFALLTAFVVQYLFAFVLPIGLAGMFVVSLAIWFSHRKFKET